MSVSSLYRTIVHLKSILMAVLTPTVLLPILYEVDGKAGRCAYAASILIVFWVFEVLPLPVTSLLPVLLFPVLGVLNTSEVCAEYVKNPSLTILGMLGVVTALERWNLHKRISLRILLICGTKPHWLILGVLICTAVLSAFITAGVTILMIPIVHGIADKLQSEPPVTVSGTDLPDNGSDNGTAIRMGRNVKPSHQKELTRLNKALCLCIGHGTSIGASSTLPGHPANFVTVALIEEFYRSYGLTSKLTFLGWLVFAVPYVVIVLLLSWVVYVIVFLRGKGLFRRTTTTEEMAESEQRLQNHFRTEYKNLGPWSYPEYVVTTMLVLLMALFFSEDLYFTKGWDSLFQPGFVSSSGPAVLVSVLLFLIPSNSPIELFRRWKDIKRERFVPILSWKDMCRTTPWGVLLVIGSGFALVKAGFQKLEVLALAAENKRLTEEYSKLVLEYENELRKNATQKRTASSPSHTYQTISTSTLDKDSFQYYTGFSHERFFDLFNFLVPDSEAPFKLSKNLNCFSCIPYQDQLLFVLMKLRQDFDFKHLSFLFGISSQDCSTLFSVWVNYMYHQLGSLVIWPHRDVIISKMPQQFKEDFPNTMVIIDGTEVKVQRPSSLNRQSQCYSDYKSCTTLKGLVGVDPRGSVIFASMLFTGSISDKELTSRCGFYDTIKSLLDNGKLKKGDCVMADKGFTINDEIKNLGLVLNIPPFVPVSANQMKAADVTETIKIAQHRVHVERAISRIKQFKILANKVTLSLFSSINQIWLVCCLLTNFMPFLIQESANEP